MRKPAPAILVCLLLLALAAGIVLVKSDTFIWVDERGVTHMTNDPQRAAEVMEQAWHGREPLAQLWDGPLGPGSVVAEPRDPAEARTQRLLRGAVSDLTRGETARASVVLEGILREQPTRPEPHWYLALLARHRGRYEAAEAHLEAFLASAGDDFQTWRTDAEARLAKLADERTLATASQAGDPARWNGTDSSHFRVVLDPDLESYSPDYAKTVLGYLEQARVDASERLGAEPDESMGVVFYGRSAYDRVHARRFSFRTVGFFDGRIHVVSAAHPQGELRALLFHEYVHAIFRQQTGADRPYWWNEGLAELAERESRGQPGLTRSERSALRRRIDARDWIPLRRLAPSFSGLDDDDARAAYLEAAAAALWIEQRSDRAERARMLEILAEGRGDDAAFQGVLGMTTDQIDRAVRDWIREEFPTTVTRSEAPRSP
ncbi:MAG: DUF4124 domain-containing protein [Myxococcota bacterium]